MRGLAPAISSTFDHAAGRLEDRVDEDRPGQPGLGLELGEQPVDVVDVLGALHLGHHDDVELVADLGDERREVVERPRAVERVDPRPELGVLAEVGGLGDLDEPRAGGLLAVGLDGVLEVAERARRPCRRCPAPWPPSSGCSGRRSGCIRHGRAGTSRERASAPPPRAGAKKSLALRMGANVAAALVAPRYDDSHACHR